MQLIKLQFFSYTRSCYIQTLVPSRHGHMNSPCPRPPHSTSVPTHTDFYHTSHTAPYVLPKLSTMAREVRKKNIRSCYSSPPLPPPQPSSPHSTLSKTDHTVQPHSPLFGTNVGTTGQQGKDCYTQQTSQAHHTAYEHREGDWRGGGREGRLSDARTQTKVILGKGSS